MDVRSLMRRSARYHADRVAVVHGERRVSFADAWERGCRVANGLRGLGLDSQDRIGVLEINSVGAADLFAGAAAANLVKVPLYPRNRREAHVHMLSHTGCRALVVDGALADEAEGLLDAVPSLEHVVVRDDGYEDWLAAQDPTDPDPAVDADDHLIIRHTGGTTGLPKGVAYTHRSWLAAGRDWFYLFPPVEPGDACLHVGPISHGSGYFFVPIWLAGATNVLLDHFDPDLVLDTWERESIGYGFMVPTMLNSVVRHPAIEDREFPALKCLQIGGSPIADDTARRAHDVLGDRLWQGYGQTEAVPVAMMGPGQWFAAVEGSEPLRSAGMLLPFADLEIRDEEGNEVPVGESGEIVVRCDGQMSGFWEDADATAERIVDGWVRSGDIGRVDANGYLYVLDRAGDMIISGGFNLYPAEIENVLTEHPDVVEAAVFAVPSDRWGESPRAVCTVVDGSTVTGDELVALVGERLGSYQRPVAVDLTADPLPKSPVGKIMRKQLREPHWAGHDRRVSGS
ncbi:MAG: AMP-binding protein [Actinomycetota bacterium]